MNFTTHLKHYWLVQPLTYMSKKAYFAVDFFPIHTNLSDSLIGILS